MAKFPINPLLYLITLGLLGGSGFYFYEAVNLPTQPDRKQDRKLALTAIERGKKLDPQEAGENYGSKLPWQNFADANFTGKQPPKPVVKPQDEGPATPKADTETPFDDIFTILGIYYDGPRSWVIISYKPAAGVQAPDAEIKKRLAQQKSQQQPPGARVRPGVRGVRGQAANRRNRGNRGQQINLPVAASPNAAMVHHLSLEDADNSALWPPYQQIRLVSVSPSAEYAVFQRQEHDKEEADWEETKIYKGILDLPQGIIAALVEGSKGGNGSIQRPQPQATRQPSADNPWQPTPTTKKVGRGKWDIGREEISRIRKDPARVFNEEIGFKSYRGTGGRRGLRLTKITPRFQSFGFQVGEIIVALNGRPVGNRAQAITLGKKLYQSGVRTFKVMVLNSQGYKEERVYHAPN